MDMEDYTNVNIDDSSGKSLHSDYEVYVNLFGDGKESFFSQVRRSPLSA